MAYLASPLWFLFLLLGTWIAWERYQSGLSQLPFENYVDRWLGINGSQQSLILTLFIFTLLFLPKILAVIIAILHGPTRRSFGGMLRILFGAGFETIVSMLLAPSIMVSHTVMVISMLLGRSVGWGNQNRETDGTAWSDALRFHAITTLLGIAWTVLAMRISPYFAAWMSPILLGLIFSAPVSVWTSRVRNGQALARRGLLSTPEERIPPEIICLADVANSAVDPALDAATEGRRGVIAAVVDPYVNGVHVSLLEQSELTPADEALAEQLLAEGPSGITKNEMSDLLYHSAAMLLMHRGVWLRSAEGIHHTWNQAVESYRRRLDQVL
jgi:membrane glycosyltransferase